MAIKNIEEKIDWQTPFSFGKYKGEKIITVWIKDKPYIKWLIDNYDNCLEVQFILETVNEKELDNL